MCISNISGANRLIHIAAKKVPKKAVDRGVGHILCMLHSPHKYYSFKYKVICMLCEFQLDKSRSGDGRNDPQLFQYACIL